MEYKVNQLLDVSRFILMYIYLFNEQVVYELRAIGIDLPGVQSIKTSNNHFIALYQP